MGVSAQCLFDLLVSLEGETPDALDALELVKAEKPLRSLGKPLHIFIEAFTCFNCLFFLTAFLLLSCRFLLRQRGFGLYHQRGHQVVCHRGRLRP